MTGLADIPHLPVFTELALAHVQLLVIDQPMQEHGEVKQHLENHISVANVPLVGEAHLGLENKVILPFRVDCRLCTLEESR